MLQNHVSVVVSLIMLWDLFMISVVESQFLSVHLFLCVEVPRISVLLFYKLTPL